MNATEQMVRMQSTLHKMGYGVSNETFAIVNEGDKIPKDGIEFDVDPTLVPKMTKSLLNSVRRLHVKCGHPPNAELERIVKFS